MRYGLLLFLAMFSFSAVADTLEIKVDGYKAEVGVHPAAAPQGVVVIALHGKGKGRLHPELVAFAAALAEAGYTTYTPDMPWNGYKAPAWTVYTFLDALIGRVAAAGEKVVIAGHSQGAPYSLFYVTDHTPPPQVAGIVLMAPAHMLHRSKILQRETAESVVRANQMVAAGSGTEISEFADFNRGGGTGFKVVETTAQIYLSYFDLESSPNFLTLISTPKIPLLWVDGSEDLLPRRMRYPEIYALAPSNPKNGYVAVRGGHITMLKNASAPVISWLRGLE